MIHHIIQGEKVPALGLGTWRLSGEACREAVRHALALGYRHLDTAQSYANEGDVGQGLEEAGVDRDEVFLTTKIWPNNLAPEDARRSTEASLRELKTDYVDLLLIHWPTDEVPLERTLDALLDLREEEKTRHIGVSNFTPSLLRRALDHAPLFCIQVEHHPFLAQDELEIIARERDLLFTAYAPIARGKVTEDETLRELAEKYDKTPVQVALRWLVQQDHVAAIPKAARPEHREANLDLFDFELAPEEIKRIAALDRGERLVNPPTAPAWER